MSATTITTRTVTNRIGRLAAAALAAGVGVVGFAIPAAADAPAEFTVTNTFPDINPCTGEPMEVTITAEVREHVHANGNIVARAARTGATSDGYVMDHGRDSFVFNGKVASGTFTDTWRSADGSHFKAQGVFVSKEDGVVVDRYRLRCVKP